MDTTSTKDTGRIGGITAWKGVSKTERKQKMTALAVARWTKYREELKNNPPKMRTIRRNSHGQILPRDQWRTVPLESPKGEIIN